MHERLMDNNDHEKWGMTDQIILQIEKFYKARFVGYFALKDGDRWTADAFPIFYQPHPDLEAGHKHYFAIWRKNGQTFILDGTSAFSQPIQAVQAEDGEIIYSRSRHDFVVSGDGSVTIDGGRDYSRSMGAYLMLTIVMIDGKLQVQS